jgi:hypothetical protein
MVDDLTIIRNGPARPSSAPETCLIKLSDPLEQLETLMDIANYTTGK